MRKARTRWRLLCVAVAAAACAANAGEESIEGNEAAAKAACRAYWQAQEIYHRTDYDGDGVLEYAQALHGGQRPVTRAPDVAALPKPTEEEQRTIEKLIKDCGNDEFAARERASQELGRMGPKAYAQIQAAVKTVRDAEVLQRCRKLADQIAAALAPAPAPEMRYGLYMWGRDDRALLGLINRAMAEAEWPLGADGANAVPKDGYFFRVLKRQGESATGGAKSFLVGNHMTLGHGLLAFPKDYGVTGRKCFLTSHLGVVYERDCGSKEQTEAYVRKCDEFNPTKEWKPAE
ncbi:MAG: DUF2950 family protein [Planctomycetota bacterium]|nr:DUF2950 family protein [Planctomycetota bacterium]